MAVEHKMEKNILLLDCTLRDGGFCLEDIAKNAPPPYFSHTHTKKVFDSHSLNKIAQHLASSNIDIIELGGIERSKEDKRCFAIYQSIEDISEVIPENILPGQMYAALYRGPDTPIDEIPDWHPSLCEAVRVILRYSELQKSLEFCADLSRKGYKVFVQPMLTMRYSDEEIQMLIDVSNKMNAYALYFVDSYGYMMNEDILHFFNIFNTGLDPKIKIGFHAHNNMGLAFANVLALINASEKRNIIIDSCALGMGQGAGNLQTEIIADYLNRTAGCSYNYNEILAVCEIVNEYYGNNLWGYSVARFLPAARKVAYKYSVALRERYGFSFREIDRILCNMPDNLRHRYTRENVEMLVRLTGEA